MGIRTSFRVSNLLPLLGAALCALCGAARAGTLVPEDSTLSIRLGGIGPFIHMTIEARPGTEELVALSDDGSGGHQLVIGSNIWSTLNYGIGTSLLTGVPLVSKAVVSVTNDSGSFTSGHTHVGYIGGNQIVGPLLGGDAPLDGELYLWVAGNRALGFGMSIFGQQYLPYCSVGIPCLAYPTGSPWVTGAVPITSVTTNVISVNGVTGVAFTLEPPQGALIRTISTGGGFVSTGGGPPAEAHTVTVSGSNQLVSASGSGRVTMVSPARINTPSAIFGTLPARARMTLRFVPEPGTLLLLVTGAAALARIGGRRMRR
jgi:hypothetical protein